MSTSGPSGRSDVRALVFGALTIGALLLVGKGVPAVRQAITFRASAATLAYERGEVDRRLTSAEKLVRAATLQAEDVHRRLERVLLPGATPAEAAASLAMLIDRYAEDARVRVSSTTAQADTLFMTAHPIISVRVFATTDVQGLVDLLPRIEGSEFLLGVRELTLTQPEPAAGDDVPGSLRIELVVEALARQGTALVAVR